MTVNQTQDFESLSDGNSIGNLSNWVVDYGDARCDDHVTFGKVFDVYSTVANESCYTRVTDATSSVDQWMLFQLPNWGSEDSVGPAFRMSGATGYRYYVRIHANEFIEWARENGSSDYSNIQNSGTVATPTSGDYFGFSVSGTGASTVVKYWDFGAEDPSHIGPTSWGAATWTSTQDPTNVGGSDYSVDTGSYLGLSYYYRTAGDQYVDNVAYGPFAAGGGVPGVVLLI